MQNDIVIRQLIKEDQILSIVSPKDKIKISLPVLSDYIADHHDALMELLLTHGGILFRGFDINSKEDFYLVKEKLAGSADFSYTDGNSPRTKISANIYTSTEYPQEYRISLHNELSYSNKWPHYILFYCHTPAEEGGETPLVDCRKILKKLSPGIVDDFEKYGVKYTRYLNGSKGVGKSWINTFETEDKNIIEKYCQDNAIEFFWEGDCLYLSHQGAGIIKHPVTGEKVWFNQANQFHPSSLPDDVYKGMKFLFAKKKHKYPHYAYYGNGEEIPAEYLTEITETHFDHALTFPWEKGDVVILDNMLMAHGRMPYKGERKVYVSMC